MLDMVRREGVPRTSFEQRPEGKNGHSHANIAGDVILHKRRVCRGPAVKFAQETARRSVWMDECD